MSRDANGLYTLPLADVITGTVITSVWANTTMNDVKNALTDSLSRTGQGGMSVPLKAVSGTVANPGYTFLDELAMGMYRVSSGVMGFPMGGSLQATISDGLAGAQDLFTNAKLAGYQVDGLLVEYTDDLDDINYNSSFSILGSAVNAPDDMGDGNRGTLHTDMTRAAQGTQLVIGGSGDDWKIWQRTRSASVWQAWKLVVDGGAFTQRLAGYLDTGIHDEYRDDLDLLITNSVYYIQSSGVTNAPADLSGEAVLYTDMSDGPTSGVQVIYGYTLGNEWKQWQRGRRTSAWQAWKLVVDGGAFTERLAGYEDTGFHPRFTGDADDILVNSQHNVSAASLINGPADFANLGTLTTQMYLDTTFADQILYGQSGGSVWKIWMRSREASVWGVWKLVVDGGAFTERLAGYADNGFSLAYTGDLDDLTGSANYAILPANVTNEPADMVSWGIITVQPLNDGLDVVQTIRGIRPGDAYKTWQRTKSTTWNAWVLVVDGPAATENLVGEIKIWSTNNEPTGYLKCEGQALLRTGTYAALFAVIGVNWGIGDGSTTFNIPDLRGQFLRGRDTGRGLDPNAATRTQSAGGGAQADNVGSEQAEDLLSHNHTLSRRAITFGSSVGAAGTDGNHNLSDDTATILAAGGDETRPTNVYVNYIIRF